MKRSTLKAAAVLFAAVAVSAFAEEIAAIKAPADFRQAKSVSFEDGVFSFKGKGTLSSVVKLPADPAKKYRLSGEFRAKDGTVPARVYFGLIPLDAEGKQIQPYHIHVIPGSATETVADAKKGDKNLLVRKASWAGQAPHSFVAFNAKDDLSDLPNRDVIYIVPKGIQPDGDNLKINLSAPLKKDIPAGTKVRQHLAGDTYIYCAGSAYTNNKWTLRTGSVSGVAKSTRSDSLFWPGTAKFQVTIHITGGSKDSVTEFRNIKVVADGTLKLDPVFSSNMVLQQEKPIAFFGTAGPGAEIQVGFNGKNVRSTADAKGIWKAVFPAMKAGKTAYTVTVTDGKDKIELQNIMIGEVWFCAGQSNMEMPVGKWVQNWCTQNSEQEVAAARYPEIRFIGQKGVFSHNVQLPAQYSPNFPLGWAECSPDTTRNFSAVAYFFGRRLHQDLDVPIGLITAAWSGTRIETWISPAGYEAFGPKSDLKILKKYRLDTAGKAAHERKEPERFRQEMAAWHPLFEKAGADARAKTQEWSSADFDDSGWRAAGLILSPRYVVRWFRLRFSLPPEMQGKEVVFTMNKAGEKADIWLNGEKISGWNADAPEDSKRAVVKLTPAQLNQTGKNVIAVRAEYFYGQDCRLQMKRVFSYSQLAAGKNKLVLDKGWKMKDEFSCTSAATENKTVPPFIQIPYRSEQFQSNLFNGMVAGWTKLPVRGVIWYQGCSNRGEIHYCPLLKTLIADWRARWNQPEMPFLIVQLAGYDPNHPKDWKTANPNKISEFPLTRDIQQQMLHIPNVGLATAIDVGEVNSIHPSNKQDVGKRLALEAERIVYGKRIVSCGPLFESAKPEGNAIRVSFKYADSGLKTSDGKEPGAFAVAGTDRKFVWADARIDGKTVIVSSPQVKEPRYVRYAYAGYRGDCNLQNAEGLPAYPFRSDSIDYSQVK